MKIEMGESLCCSFLRHVQQCWVVQANWKVSQHWGKLLGDDELEELFRSMRESFDPDGTILKQTKDEKQFLKQGEIDVVGVGQDGSVHAMEVAFHENGLNYLGGADKRVLKKLLRTLLILEAYHPPQVERHIYFASPKVSRGVQGPLEEMFEMLAAEYPAVEWHLLTNEEFNRRLLVPTLEKAEQVSDTAELFVRAAKLLELGVPRTERGVRRRHNDAGDSTALSGPAVIQEAGARGAGPERRGRGRPPRESRVPTVIQEAGPERGGDGVTNPRTPAGQLQPLVRGLMRTVLEDHPGLLGETDLWNMMDSDLCKDELGLQLGGFPLLRRVEDGRMEGGRPRYWSKVYGEEFYVTNNWWQDYHLENAGALARFVEGLVRRRAEHPAVPELERHRAALERYAG